MSEISLAAVNRIVKKVDPNIRIGKQTTTELCASIEDYASRISELAISLARNANRNTVLVQDIETAKEQLITGISFVP